MHELKKTSGIILAGHDVYVNVAGGIKIAETAVDLGIMMAVMSSFKNQALPQDILVIGEVGLSGEIRAVRGAELRINEAKKLGFKKIIVPQKNLLQLKKKMNVELCGISRVQEALNLFF